MKQIIFFLVLFSKTICDASAQQWLDYKNYRLVLEENFDSIKSIEELTDIWQFHHDDPGYGWGDYYDSSTQIFNPGEYYDKSMVSLRKKGYLRLTAKRVDGKDEIFSAWRNGIRRPMYKSGMIQLRLDVSDPRLDKMGDRSGFVYGMFEIRVRLPKDNENFAAFWLTRADVSTEIDIFEYGEHDYWLSNNVIDRFENKSSYRLYQPNSIRGFVTITAVWTPNGVCFFDDGRLVRCVPSTEIATQARILSLVANLAMRPYFSIRKQHMDIDYIRVYKPVGNNYALPFIRSSTGVLE